jgi:hypothetical protein
MIAQALILDVNIAVCLLNKNSHQRRPNASEKPKSNSIFRLIMRDHSLAA